MKKSIVIRKAAASLMAVGMVLATVPTVGSAASIFGTIQVQGSAWVASGTDSWSELSRTRPLVAGDKLKTAADGYLLADLGSQGVVGLYGNAEVTANDSGRGPVIDILRGKVAFHFGDKSALSLRANGADIAAGDAADGYVDLTDGKAAVVVEKGSLNIVMAGVSRQLKRGQRLELEAGAQPVQLAGAEAGAAAASASGTAAATTIAGLSTTALTAIGVVAVGVGAAAAAGGDSVASPSN